jgi:hypothetical protein
MLVVSTSLGDKVRVGLELGLGTGLLDLFRLGVGVMVRVGVRIRDRIVCCSTGRG